MASLDLTSSADNTAVSGQRSLTAPASRAGYAARIAIAEDLTRAGPSQGYCLIVVPTYNEAANIERLVAEILAQGPQFDVLVVDDNSPDGTGDLVAALAARTSRVQLLRRPGKLGLGSAYVAGFHAGLRQGYAYLCEMDADFSHQPRYLPQLLAVAEQSADLALGSRNVPGGRVEQWSLLRQAISRGGSLYARTILGMPIADCTGGFKCFRAAVLQRLDLGAIRSNGYAFQVEMNYRCHQAGFRIREIQIVFPDRVAGRSKMSQRIVWEAALMVWKLRLSPNPDKQVSLARPLRFGLVGLSGLAVNSAILWALTRGAHLPVALASALATETAILHNFMLNDRWTFREARRHRSLAQRLLRFNTVALGGLFITVALLTGLSAAGHLHLLLANLLAVGVATAWNYLVNAWWTWRDQPGEELAA